MRTGGRSNRGGSFFGCGEERESEIRVESSDKQMFLFRSAEQGNGRNLIGWVMVNTILLFWAGGAFSFHPAGVAAQLGSGEISEGDPAEPPLWGGFVGGIDETCLSTGSCLRMGIMGFTVV